MRRTFANVSTMTGELLQIAAARCACCGNSGLKIGTSVAAGISSSFESPNDAPKPHIRDSNPEEPPPPVVDSDARRHRPKSASDRPERYSQPTKAPGRNCEFVDGQYSRTDR